MDGTLGLLGSTSGDGEGGVPSGGSTTAGSVLTMAKEDLGMSGEVSSPYPVGDDLELGLGLSIGVAGAGAGAGGGLKSNAAAPFWGQYARILTAEDLTCLISKHDSSSSSSSSSVKNPNLSVSGTKRSATDSVSPPSVVGWPPIRRAHWMPSLANQTKPPDEQSSSIPEQTKTDHSSQDAKKGYLPVKVNMDGTFIGRKVDLNAHTSYETLAQTLEDMFCRKRSGTEAMRPSKLLDGSSEFVLTYEDKDGDCMLVGDVPWPMFLSSIKRLRIIRNSKSNELGKHKHDDTPFTFQEKNARRRTDEFNKVLSGSRVMT